MWKPACIGSLMILRPVFWVPEFACTLYFICILLFAVLSYSSLGLLYQLTKISPSSFYTKKDVGGFYAFLL